MEMCTKHTLNTFRAELLKVPRYLEAPPPLQVLELLSMVRMVTHK